MKINGLTRKYHTVHSLQSKWYGRGCEKLLSTICENLPVERANIARGKTEEIVDHERDALPGIAEPLSEYIPQ